MAKNYIDNLSEETRKGMIEKAEQGIFPSFAPLGYINVECEGQRFIQQSKEWEKEQYDIFRKIERHQRADGSYMEEGVKLLELAQRAVILYGKQNIMEKSRIINFVCSNSPWKDGRLLPNYRKPFDILSENNRAYKRKKAIFSMKNDRFIIWLPG